MIYLSAEKVSAKMRLKAASHRPEDEPTEHRGWMKKESALAFVFVSNEFSENELGRASSRQYECVRLSKHSKCVFSKNVFMEIKKKKKGFVLEESFSFFHNCVEMLRITGI